MWNVLAIWRGVNGNAGVPKDDKAAAQKFLGGVLNEREVMDKGARESIMTFEKGVGDAAITYENEVLVGEEGQSRLRDAALDDPDREPRCVVDAYAEKHGVRDVADAFVDFLGTPEAQRAFAEYGLRPVDASIAAGMTAQFQAVEDLWKIDFLGGWSKVTREMYGPEGTFTKIMGGAREVSASAGLRRRARRRTPNLVPRPARPPVHGDDSGYARRSWPT